MNTSWTKMGKMCCEASATYAESRPMAAFRSATTSPALLLAARKSYIIRQALVLGMGAGRVRMRPCAKPTLLTLFAQACLDKFLRSNKLDKSRKTGFKCPRGCGKGSSFPAPCPGRVGGHAAWWVHRRSQIHAAPTPCNCAQIDKSHPIFPRNETKKHKVTASEREAGPPLACHA